MNDGLLFLIYILIGIIIGVVFDIFRILRKSFKTSDFITYIEDIFFWIITGGILLFAIFFFSKGELRGYIFFGLIIGIALYMLTISRLFIKLSVGVFNIIKKIFSIIFLPFKLIISIVKKGISKIKTLLYNFIKNITKKVNFNRKKEGI